MFRVDARVAYVLVVKISNFFDLKKNYVALVECEWLIFKLHFGLDNDLYWI
jgi:hypothetical protein